MTIDSTKSSTSILTAALFVLVPLLLATPSKALGYADPGTGAVVYQALYVGFLTATFYFRKVLNRIWGKKKK